MYFPKSVQTAKADENGRKCSCNKHGVSSPITKIKFKWKRGTLPPQMMDPNSHAMAMCVLCDEDLIEFMDFKPPKVDSGGHGGGRGGGRGRGNYGGRNGGGRNGGSRGNNRGGRW
ncbi:hypothetical protein TrLO_g4353 [Triparma laevis f. longispina]|uniref:Uncharacterized protein n=1 Tax=Triparma laevis f. longispina TaxID=1714387 RepID=A0A9W7APZ1_9STRA|nr:hypothetical protein TrLO_g4353 [Triparma laevis f. longispina]